MSFTFFVLCFILIGSYWYIFRFEKSSIRITLDELQIYKKLTIAATSLFIVGTIFSFFIGMNIVDIIYLISLSVVLYSDYYVFKRYHVLEKATK
ncbi:MAG: hypothetical protein WC121_13610 [Candidatus Kapaibacterium sp.]